MKTFHEFMENELLPALREQFKDADVYEMESDSDGNWIGTRGNADKMPVVDSGGVYVATLNVNVAERTFSFGEPPPQPDPLIFEAEEDTESSEREN